MNPLVDSKSRMLASGFTIAAQTAAAVAATAAGNRAGSALLIGGVVLSSLSGLAGNSLVADFHSQLERPTPDPDARRWNNDILRASVLAIADILQALATEWNAPTAASVTALASMIATLYDEVDDHDPMAVVTESEVRRSMEKGDAFRQETAGSAALWTAFLHHVIQTHSSLPAIAQPVLDTLGEAIAHRFNNQLFQVLKFDFDSERSTIHGHAYAAVTLKLLMESAAAQRMTLEQMTEMRQDQREQHASVLANLSAGLASGIGQTVSTTGRRGTRSSSERKELRQLAKILEDSATELRACREKLLFLHSLPSRLASLIDASLNQIHHDISAIQYQHARARKEIRSSQKLIVVSLSLVFTLLTLVGFYVWLVKQDSITAKHQGKQIIAAQQTAKMQATDLAAKLSDVQKAMSELMQRSDPTIDPVSKWPRSRIEAELAREMNVNVEELRAILASGSASLDALVAGQAFLALGRQKEAETKFDLVIQNERASVQRLWRAYLGKGHIAYDDSRFDDALLYYKKCANLIDKDADPGYWISAKMAVICTLYQLQREPDILPEFLEIGIFATGKRFPIDISAAGQDFNFTFEPILRRGIGVAMKSEISPIVSMFDILQPTDFLTRLKMGSDPVSKFLWNRISSGEKQFIDSSSLPLALPSALARSLNKILYSGPIYSADLFSGLLLRDETRRLLEAKPQGSDAARLNRLLLEDAYPGILRKKYFRGSKELQEGAVPLFGKYINLCRVMQIKDDEIHRRLNLERDWSGWSVETFEASWLEALKANPKWPFLVTVKEVMADGQGPALGIRVGDILRRYNGESVTDVVQAAKLTGETKSGEIPIELQRGTENLRLNAKPGRLGLLLVNEPRQ